MQDPSTLEWEVFKEPYYWKQHNLFVLADAFDEYGERYHIVKGDSSAERLSNAYVLPETILSKITKLRTITII
jgi:hypothetical protein